MFKQTRLLFCLKYGLAAAILYCIPVIFFIRNADYTDAWLLYLGNALFLGVIAVFMLSYNRKKKENASSVALLIAGHVTAVMGIIIACLFCFIIVTMMVPGLFDSGTADKVLTGEPSNMVHGKTDGLTFMVFMNAIIGNISTGSFASIIFAFTPLLDQTKETPLNKGA